MRTGILASYVFSCPHIYCAVGAAIGSDVVAVVTLLSASVVDDKVSADLVWANARANELIECFFKMRSFTSYRERKNEEEASGGRGEKKLKKKRKNNEWLLAS